MTNQHNTHNNPHSETHNKQTYTRNNIYNHTYLQWHTLKDIREKLMHFFVLEQWFFCIRTVVIFFLSKY